MTVSATERATEWAAEGADKWAIKLEIGITSSIKPANSGGQHATLSASSIWFVLFQIARES